MRWLQFSDGLELKTTCTHLIVINRKLNQISSSGVSVVKQLALFGAMQIEFRFQVDLDFPTDCFSNRDYK